MSDTTESPTPERPYDIWETVTGMRRSIVRCKCCLREKPSHAFDCEFAALQQRLEAVEQHHAAELAVARMRLEAAEWYRDLFLGMLEDAISELAALSQREKQQ